MSKIPTVECLTGMEFESCAEAGRVLNASTKAISKAIQHTFDCYDRGWPVGVFNLRCRDVPSKDWVDLGGTMDGMIAYGESHFMTPDLAPSLDPNPDPIPYKPHNIRAHVILAVADLAPKILERLSFYKRQLGAA